MQDVSVVLDVRPGALADFSQTLGAAGVSLEGGGVFTVGNTSVAHFLVTGADRARDALDAAGLGPVTISDVVTLRLDQDTPGQLGAFTRLLGDAGIAIPVQYSDHDHRLVLIVSADRYADAAEIAAAWDDERKHRGEAYDRSSRVTSRIGRPSE